MVKSQNIKISSKDNTFLFNSRSYGNVFWCLARTRNNDFITFGKYRSILQRRKCIYRFYNRGIICVQSAIENNRIAL